MKTKFIISLIFVLLLGAHIFAQTDDLNAERNQGWKAFNKKGWDKVDFTRKKITKTQLTKLNSDDGVVDELALLRGVVFGKRGRIFKEHSIQDYLDKQTWYKRNPNFMNAGLTKMESDNLDTIRLLEAERHYFVQPGDLRYWEDKIIPEDKMPTEGSVTRAEWDVMIAEFEAIHGKTFPEQDWMQKYFNERYWYRANPNYDAAVLSENDRKNLQAFIDVKNSLRKVELSPGDMDKFETVLIKPMQLEGLNFNELRIIRNEFFARHGKKFSTPGYRAFFEWQDWYRPVKDQSKIKLDPTEEQNVKTIGDYEAKMREKLTTEVLPPDAVEGLFAEDLRIMRNEIFAKHGRIFKKPELQKYFEAQAWYKPDPEFTDDKVPTLLSTVEFKNLAAIKTAEDEAVSKFSEVEG
ncbi:MAG: YARHG domain-containing protein [Pyrinomonadaceae bacterium]